jgi:CRISPR-associated protein Cas5h
VKILSFRLQGKMAHFRCYYSNSSALSHTIPPRTTICGILAGLLGYERDSYYEDFSLAKCQIAVASMAPIKKQIQKMNLLMIKKNDDLNGSQEHHSQTATEFVLPQNIRTGIIDYQIWIHHTDEKIMERLEKLLLQSKIGYASTGMPVALGTAYNMGWLQYEGIFTGMELSNDSVVPISSVIPLKNLKNLDMAMNNENLTYKLIKEDLPLEFDNARRLTQHGKGNMVINLYATPVFARVEKYTRLNNDTVITWMA